MGIDLIPDVPINYTSVNVNNSQYLQGYTPSNFIFSSNEGNLNVNSSDYWDSLNTFNSTQMQNSGGVLNILESWLNSLTNLISTYNATYDAKVSFNNTNLAYLNNTNQVFTGVNNFTNNVTFKGLVNQRGDLFALSNHTSSKFGATTFNYSGVLISNRNFWFEDTIQDYVSTYNFTLVSSYAQMAPNLCWGTPGTLGGSNPSQFCMSYDGSNGWATATGGASSFAIGQFSTGGFHFGGSAQNYVDARSNGEMRMYANENTSMTAGIGEFVVMDSKAFFNKLNVSIGTSQINAPLTVNGSINGNSLSIWASHNISATGYITRTPKLEDYKKDYLTKIKNPSEMLDNNGKLNRDSLLGGEIADYQVIDYSNCSIIDDGIDYCYTAKGKDVCSKDIKNIPVEQLNRGNNFTIENKREVCGTKTEQGMSLDYVEVNNRLLISELKEYIQKLEARIVILEGK